MEGLTQQWKQEPSCTPDSPPIRNPSPPRPLPHPLTRAGCVKSVNPHQKLDLKPLPFPLSRGDTEILYHCPIYCPEVLQKKQIFTQYGHWEYYRCPVAKCFVTCGVDHVEHYVDSAKRQLDEFYLENELEKMPCYCELPLIVSQSQSIKNPGRMFFKCSKWNCQFFQWVDQTPNRKIRAWLLEREPANGYGNYPRHQESFKPKSKYIRKATRQRGANIPRIRPSLRCPPFDPDLWDKCQNAKFFFITDHPDIIAFPREL